MTLSNYDAKSVYSSESEDIGQTIHVKASGVLGSLVPSKQRERHSSFSLHSVNRLTPSGLEPPADIEPSSEEFKTAVLPMIQKDTWSKVQDRLAEDASKQEGEPVWVLHRLSPSQKGNSIAFLAFGQKYEIEQSGRYWNLHISPFDIYDEKLRLAAIPFDNFATQGTYLFRIGWTTKPRHDFEAILTKRLENRGKSIADYKEFFDINGQSVLSQGALDLDWLSVITCETETAKATSDGGPPAAVTSTWASRLSLLRSALGPDKECALEETLRVLQEHIKGRESRYVNKLALDTLRLKAPQRTTDPNYNPMKNPGPRALAGIYIFSGGTVGAGAM